MHAGLHACRPAWLRMPISSCTCTLDAACVSGAHAPTRSRCQRASSPPPQHLLQLIHWLDALWGLHCAAATHAIKTVHSSLSPGPSIEVSSRAHATQHMHLTRHLSLHAPHCRPSLFHPRHLSRPALLADVSIGCRRMALLARAHARARACQRTVKRLLGTPADDLQLLRAMPTWARLGQRECRLHMHA